MIKCKEHFVNAQALQAFSATVEYKLSLKNPEINIQILEIFPQIARHSLVIDRCLHCFDQNK